MTDFILQTFHLKKRLEENNYSKHGMQFFVCKGLSETGFPEVN